MDRLSSSLKNIRPIHAVIVGLIIVVVIAIISFGAKKESFGPVDPSELLAADARLRSQQLNDIVADTLVAEQSSVGLSQKSTFSKMSAIPRFV